MKQVATVEGEFVIMLAVICASVSTSSRQVPEVSDLLTFLPSSVDNHHSKLHDITQQCDELSYCNIFWRLLQQGVDKNGLSAIKENLQNAIQQFQVFHSNPDGFILKAS